MIVCNIGLIQSSLPLICTTHAMLPLLLSFLRSKIPEHKSYSKSRIIIIMLSITA